MSEGLCFVLGSVFGAWLAWHFWLRREPPKIEMKIDPAVLSQLNTLIVTAWLEQRGLVWMPKGVDFKATVKKS